MCTNRVRECTAIVRFSAREANKRVTTFGQLLAPLACFRTPACRFALFIELDLAQSLAHDQRPWPNMIDAFFVCPFRGFHQPHQPISRSRQLHGPGALQVVHAILQHRDAASPMISPSVRPQTERPSARTIKLEPASLHKFNATCTMRPSTQNGSRFDCHA